MKSITKKYTNGDVTIVWQPALCVHSAKCFLGLPGVFDPTKRPWINPQGTDTRRMIEQVNQCPSGALSYYLNSEEKKGK
jgi:uncharacterized Fe-S cluster protein YjdI